MIITLPPDTNIRLKLTPCEGWLSRIFDTEYDIQIESEQEIDVLILSESGLAEFEAGKKFKPIKTKKLHGTKQIRFGQIRYLLIINNSDQPVAVWRRVIGGL